MDGVVDSFILEERNHDRANFSAPKYIDVHVVESMSRIWRLTCIYGEPKWEDMFKTWDKLRELNETNNLP
jgi:hypothetical protein